VPLLLLRQAPAPSLLTTCPFPHNLPRLPAPPPVLCSSFVMPPAMSVLKAAAATGPTSRCLAVNAWSLLNFGLALPTFVLRWLEQRSQETDPDEPASGPLEGPQPGAADQCSSYSQPLPAPAKLFLASCLLWTVVVAVVP